MTTRLACGRWRSILTVLSSLPLAPYGWRRKMRVAMRRTVDIDTQDTQGPRSTTLLTNATERLS